MKPLRILILTFTYPPNRDGVAEASRTMAEGFAARGHDVTVCTSFLPHRPSEWMHHGVQVRQFNVIGLDALCVGFTGEVEPFLRFVREFDGDVVVSHSWDCWSTDLARRVFSEVRARKVLVSHGFSTQIVPWHRKFPWGLGVWLRWQPYVWRLPWMMRRYDHITFLSQMGNFGRFFDHLVARWTGYRRCSVIPNSADIPAAATPGTFRATHGLRDECVFLCVANYSVRKNQELALRAFRQTRPAHAALVFIGSDFNDYARRLQELDRRLATGDAPGKVLFLQNLSRGDTAAAFHDCDVFLLSALAETQPIVLLEAMACAKPFISTDTGCVRELPGGCVVRTEAEFAAAIAQLASDPVRRRELGASGHAAFLASHTPERVLDSYEHLLATLTAEKDAAPSSPVAVAR